MKSRRSFSSKQDENNLANPGCTQQGTAKLLISAVFGNTSAQQEMRNRFPGTAAFVDACDPDLPRDSNDSAFMAEVKMYGRAVKNVRDEVVDTIFNLNAQDSDTASNESIEHVHHADGLAQREVIITRGISLALSGGFI